MSIKLSDKAAEELRALLSKEVENDNLAAGAGLRLGVEGGGCSGFSYKMAFDENISESDRVEDIKGVKVVCDHKSFLYLDGTEIDFQDSLMGRGFVFQNPNASGTCGCGSSFSM